MNEAISVGVVGLGLMGSAMAGALHRRGTPVAAWNRGSGPLAKISALGVPTCTDIGDLLARCETLIVVLSRYDVVRQVFNSVPAALLAGRTVVNLTSGSATDAKEAAVWAAERSMDYLDGSIWALPRMIGAEGTVLTCSGSARLWDRVRGAVLQLGGSSFHAGEAIEAANVLEACFPGSFFMSAQSSFIEAVRLARSQGIGIDSIAKSINPAVQLLLSGLEDVLEHIGNGDRSTSEATLDVYLNAAESYRETADSAGVSTPFLSVLVDQLRAARAAGLGALGPSALALTSEVSS